MLRAHTQRCATGSQERIQKQHESAAEINVAGTTLEVVPVGEDNMSTGARRVAFSEAKARITVGGLQFALSMKELKEPASHFLQ